MQLIPKLVTGRCCEKSSKAQLFETAKTCKDVVMPGDAVVPTVEVISQLGISGLVAVIFSCGVVVEGPLRRTRKREVFDRSKY